MKLAEPIYSFNSSSVSEYRRTRNERIVEFKGYNRRGDRADGEMMDMLNLSALEYPALSPRSKRIVIKEVNAKPNGGVVIVRGISVSRLDGNQDEVLGLLCEDTDSAHRKSYRFIIGKYELSADCGCEVSKDTRMVVINNELCFFPQKKYFKLNAESEEEKKNYKLRIGNLDAIVSRSDVNVTVLDDNNNNFKSSKLKFDEDMGFSSQFKVGDVVTINCDITGDKMLLYRSRNESDGTNDGFDIMTEPQYDLYISTNIDTGWSGSFTIPLAIPHNVKSDSFYVKYSTQGFMDTWSMPEKGSSDPDAKGIFYELDGTAGEYVTISSTNYKGAYINEIHIKLYPVRRSYYVPFKQSGKEITLLDGLYVSPSFATQTEALSWAETNYPTDITDFKSKKSAWTLLYNKDAISLRQGTNKPDAPYYLKYADVGPHTVDDDGDVELVIDYGYIKETINPVRAGMDGVSAEIKGVANTSISFPDNTFHNVTGEPLSGQTFTFNSFTISRTSPNLAYVMEANNRLWGVCDDDNTIYASKLGDPTNWQHFQNTSLDSYYAEQGSNGRWTGCASYSSHLLFFKEQCIHKVYGSFPAEFQIVTMACNGVEYGSADSIVHMNDSVVYKSPVGIMAYGGGYPTLISEGFANDRYKNVVSGGDSRKYYALMTPASGDGKRILMCYDTHYGSWYKESLPLYSYDSDPISFVTYGGRVCVLNQKRVQYAEGFDGEKSIIEDGRTESVIDWMAELGPFDEYLEDKKVYSKISMRYIMPEGSSFKIYISTNEGPYELAEEVTTATDRIEEVFITPIRCDCFSIKIKGTGECKIKSIVREFRTSTMNKER